MDGTWEAELGGSVESLRMAGARVSWPILALVWATGCTEQRFEPSRAESVPDLTFHDSITLGGADAEGPAAFGSIRSVALLLDGARFAVADGHTQLISLFSLNGDFLKSFGGRGGGPGESRAIREMRGALDGGLCTWDIQTTRITHFSSSGEVESTAHADLKGMEAIRPSFMGFVGDCGFVLQDTRSMMGMRDVPEGMRRDTVRYVGFGPDGSSTGVILRRLGAEKWFRNQDRTWGYVTPIFGEELVAFVRESELWVGTSDDMKWTRLGLSGDTLGQALIPYEVRSASDEALARERDRRVAAVVAQTAQIPLGPPDLLERMAESEREGVLEVPVRGTIPAYDVTVAGTDGALWIREYPGPADEVATWFLVDSTMSRVAKASLPRSDTIVAASSNAVLVKSRDAMDTPLLLILRR